jgi:hypothetical protein
MPEVGDTITFAIGVHVTSGVVVDVSVIGPNRLLVEVAPEIFEVVYADEIVR